MPTKTKRPDNVVDLNPETHDIPVEERANPDATVFRLTPEDHRLILALLDTMASRGAFKGKELSSAGQIYDRVAHAHSEMTKQNAE